MTTYYITYKILFYLSMLTCFKKKNKILPYMYWEKNKNTILIKSLFHNQSQPTSGILQVYIYVD